jgi:UDP-N-acetylmuramoyl-tripeptide--D-alanyl-D-alanine ligase
MIKVSSQWICRALSATMIGGALDIDEVSTDTRTINPGALFIALKGPNFDGHRFAEQAIKSGASAILVDHELDVTVPQIVVIDTTEALGALGAAIKAQLQPKTIAITGSVGKTTVKEMVAAILSRLGNVLATKGNFNNEIGVPLTLLRLEPQHDYAVIELGANHPGEIGYTTGLTKPDVCMINNVAAAHLEGFIDLYGVARAKGEIFTFSQADTIAVVNCDSEYSDYWLRRLKDRPVRKFAMSSNMSADKQVDVWVDNICMDEYGCATFDLYSKNDGVQENIMVQLVVPGRHNINNALAAASVCMSVGASLTDISLGLRQMKPVTGRVNLIKVSPSLTVIDDTYNANVESAKAAIDLLVDNAGQKVLVLGDMAELGLDARVYHEEVGDYAKAQGIDRLFTLGVLSQNASEMFNGSGKHFSSRKLLLEHLHQTLDAGQQKVTVLVKGSRSAKMELVVEALVAHYTNPPIITQEAC